jgi:branched-chain amino acid transport system ATP-binding protein
MSVADLVVENIEARYGGVTALWGVSLEVSSGQCAAVLGANGAGKTTLLKSISGLVAHRGRVLVDGEPLAGSPERIARKGVGHVLEGRQVFTQLTVRENLLVGRFGAVRGGRSDRLAVVLDAFPVLRTKFNRLGGELSGGEQQIVAIGRSLMAEPRVLLMDEPSLGLSPVIIGQLGAAIGRLRADMGTTLLIAEQSIALALEIADYFYVMQRGRISYSGPGDLESLWSEVHRAYLGGAGA